MIVVTVLRDKPVHSETISVNPSNPIRRDRRDSGSRQFQLSQPQEVGTRRSFFTLEINDITAFHLVYGQKQREFILRTEDSG